MEIMSRDISLRKCTFEEGCVEWDGGQKKDKKEQRRFP